MENAGRSGYPHGGLNAERENDRQSGAYVIQLVGRDENGCADVLHRRPQAPYR